MSYGTCKYCGCTENNACYHPKLGNCWWVDDEHEVCSHCAGLSEDDPDVIRPNDRERMAIKKKLLSAYVIPGIKTLDEVIAEVFETTIEQIKAINRKNPGKDARLFAMWYRKKHTKDTYAKIGLMYGGRDHATVLQACKKAKILIETDKEYRKKCETATKILDKLKLNQ